MNIQAYIKQKNELYEIFISYLESDCDYNDIFYIFTAFLENQKIIENRDELTSLLQMISKITKNYNKKLDFFIKIDKTFTYLGESIKKNFSNLEILKIFKKQKRIILYLIEKNILMFDQEIADCILKESDTTLHLYFYSELKFFIENKKDKKLKEKLTKLDRDIFTNFDEKRKIGENESYICSLIREDSIDDFISYVNQTNLPLSFSIKPSIFETNAFLIKHKHTTLIEYAAFFGSIQIFKYLRLNKIELASSLWLYAIHSKNADLIHILEENHVKPENASYEECLKESIKCHHNDIANYIQNNFFTNNENEDFDVNVVSYAFHYHNYGYLTDDLYNNRFIFYYACQYDCISLVKLFINTQEINLNDSIILYLLLYKVLQSFCFHRISK